ncbi:branched-chain amino acid ABC transporter permease [Fervidicella metallireducens AeB]|uniref:Branched-chain amino acid ABC transporter permease n=1 Tax=Fervidicella metallireducens AeB TaxID=1403537 RepID=A0A017RX22_9CLOT|nr:ABC transporter permease [Fervidicella metallireducens]EYE89111.1 branched-chain amino acid ABC transporter permease [Fervidicella metallireducens AeB]
MLRLVKRENIDKGTNIRIRLLFLFFSFIAISIFLLILNYNPIEVFRGMLSGAFNTSYRIKQTIITAIPLIITSIGISIAFKMKYWNIGGEGQILIGAFGAALIALNFPDMYKPLLLTVMFITAVILGGFWAVISGILKVYFNTNETIITLMLNYIALKFITYLQYGPWKDKKAMGFPKIPNFSDNAILPSIGGIHIGLIIALIIVVIGYLFMKHSKMGYEITVLGESKNTARYAGIRINKTILTAVFLSGALCGLTGFIQSSAVSQTLSIEVAGGVGYTAIIIAWLSNLSEPLMLLVSILFAALLQGSSYIQTAAGIPKSVALILQAFILFFILGSELFVKYKIAANERRAA